MRCLHYHRARRLLPLLSLILWQSPGAGAHPPTNESIIRVTQEWLRKPEDPAPLLRRAELYRQEGMHDEALADLDRVAALDPKRPDIDLHRACIHLDMERFEQAEAEFTRYVLRDSSQGGGMGSPRRPRATDEKSCVQQGGPEARGLPPREPCAAALAGRARAREHLGRAIEALDDYAAAIRIQPKLEWYLDRGRLLVREGRLHEAAENYREGLTRLDGAVLIRRELIQVEMRRGHPGEAVALIDELLPTLRVTTGWLLLRAEVFESAGDPDQARHDRLAALAEADAAVCDRPTTLRRLQHAQALAALGHTEEAAQILRGIVQSSPAYVPAVQLLESLSARGTKNLPKLTVVNDE